MTRGGSPSRDRRRANSFSSFGPTPGSAERAAKSGLSTFGRIELILYRHHPPTPSSSATLSSSAKADDPVITDAADQKSAPRLMGGPPSRAMTRAGHDNSQTVLYIPLARPRPGFRRLERA